MIDCKNHSTSGINPKWWMRPGWHPAFGDLGDGRVAKLWIFVMDFLDGNIESIPQINTVYRITKYIHMYILHPTIIKWGYVG